MQFKVYKIEQFCKEVWVTILCCERLKRSFRTQLVEVIAAKGAFITKIQLNRNFIGLKGNSEKILYCFYIFSFVLVK